MSFAVTSTRSKSVPTAIDEVTTQKWLFRLADPYNYSAAGVQPREVPAAAPGRCAPVTTHLQTHVATPACSLEEAVVRICAGRGPKASVIGQLPDSVSISGIDAGAVIDEEPWQVPVGVQESDLRPGLAELFEGEHLLIAGPARSGKSNLLLAVAEALRTAALRSGTPLHMWGMCGRRSPLQDAGLERIVVGEDGVADLMSAVRLCQEPSVLLVDDAEGFTDTDQSIAGLLGVRLPNLHVVAAGRADDLRTTYGHWTGAVRKLRCGVLLQPDVDYDGELLGAQLPRRAPVAMTPGRGYLCVGGSVRLVQCAGPAGTRFGAGRPDAMARVTG